MGRNGGGVKVSTLNLRIFFKKIFYSKTIRPGSVRAFSGTELIQITW